MAYPYAQTNRTRKPDDPLSKALMGVSPQLARPYPGAPGPGRAPVNQGYTTVPAAPDAPGLRPLKRLGTHPWQPNIGGLGGTVPEAKVHPLYAQPMTENVVTVSRPDEPFAVTQEGMAQQRSNQVRNNPLRRQAILQNRSVLDDADRAQGTSKETVRINTGLPDTKYADMTTDELWGGDKRRAFRQQQQEQLGLAPMADRRAMITARAQGRRLSPEMAAMQRTDPIMAAIVGRDPAAAATFETNRRQMDPEFMERQARGQAMAALFGGIGASENPAGAVAALPGAMRSLMGSGGGMAPGASGQAGGGPIERIRPYFIDPMQYQMFEEAYQAGDAAKMARLMQDAGVPEDDVSLGLLRSASGNRYSNYADPAGDWEITRQIKNRNRRMSGQPELP